MIFYEVALNEEERKLWENGKINIADVTDELKLIKLKIREILTLRAKYKQQQRDSLNQQVFDFGGELEISSNTENKRVFFRHDYGQRKLRGLFITYRELMTIQLEILKFQGDSSKEADRNLQNLIDSINNLPTRK